MAEANEGSRKIVIITPYALPEKGACSLRVRSFKTFFEANGFIVRVLAPKRKQGYIPEGYIRYAGLIELIKIILREKPNIVIGTSPPMTHSFFALLFCKLLGIPFILDLRDPWTYEAQEIGIYKKGSPKLLFFRLIERLSYLLADKIFAVTRNTAEIAVKGGANNSKVTVVENGTDVKLFRYDAKEGLRIRKKLGINQNDALGIYAGSFILRGVEKALAALAPLLKEGKLKLLLVVPKEANNMGSFAQLEDAIRKLAIENSVFFVDSSEKGIAFEELYKYFSAADFGIVVLQSSLSYCIPVKTYDYLACGLYVVAFGPEEGALRDLFLEHDLGLYSSSLDVFKDKVACSVSNISALRKSKPSRAHLAAKNFDREIANKKALNEIIRLVG